MIEGIIFSGRDVAAMLTGTLFAKGNAMPLIITASSFLSFLLDLCLGDPVYAFHPIRLIGSAIGRTERFLRGLFPKSKTGELLGGAVCAVLVSFGTLFCTGLILFAAYSIHPALAVGFNILLGWQALACKDLLKETRGVYDAFDVSIESARQRVSRIVGRDTNALSEEGVIRAAVETAAESLCDGIIAPLLYLMIGGAPLAFFYKAVNTMDSMIGYRNDTYLYFGRTAARMDDVLNLIPSRLAACFLILSTVFLPADTKGAFRIWRRDRRKHQSPNSAQTEAAMAGALGVSLAGPASYFGKTLNKPFIGEKNREIRREDILLANRLITCAAWIGLLLFSAVRIGIWKGWHL